MWLLVGLVCILQGCPFGSAQQPGINISEKVMKILKTDEEDILSRSRRNADIAVKRSALVNAARYLDTEIIKHEEAVAETVASARQSFSTATSQAPSILWSCLNALAVIALPGDKLEPRVGLNQ